MRLEGLRSQVANVLLISMVLFTAAPSFGSRRAKQKVSPWADQLIFSPFWESRAAQVLDARASWILDVPMEGLSRSGAVILARTPAPSIATQAGSLMAATRQRPGSNSNRKAPPPATADTFTNGAGSGLWSNGANWSLGTVPNSSDDADITGTGSAAAVTEDISSTINNLNLNSGNSWTLNNNLALTIDGSSISNAGKMTMNSTGNFTELVIGSSAVTLSGAGTLTMGNNANNLILGNATSDTLTNQSTIQGSGNLGDGRMTLSNSGTINANQPTPLTIQANGGVTNTGTTEATDGTLVFNGDTVTNTGGTISASNASTLQVINSTINGGTVTLTGPSALQLSNGTIQSGAINGSSTSVIESLSNTNNTIGGTITNPAGASILVDNNSTLNLLSGTYSGLGTVNLNSGGNFTFLQVDGSAVTLSGGSVTMSNNVNNIIIGAATSDTLTNQETISGAGNIGDGRMTLSNSGTINANRGQGMVIQANGGTTNTGTIEATGGQLEFNGTTVTNTGGKISASTNTLFVNNSTINGGTVTLTGASHLLLSNGTVQSGTLNSSSTGVIESLSNTNNTIGGTITNPTGGSILVDNNSTLNLLGGTYSSLGAVKVNSGGNFTFLQVDGSAVTLSGGSVTMSNNANNIIIGAATSDTLTNQETISGAGNIGDGRMTLSNSGTINANRAQGMVIQTSGGTTNTGTIEATGGQVEFLNSTVTNTGGTISTSGNTLFVSNSTINGGTVTLTGSSSLLLSNGTVQSGTLNPSSTSVIESLSNTNNTLGGTITNPADGSILVDNNSTLNLLPGTYTNSGTIAVNSGGNFTFLNVDGSAVTLTGGGAIVMSNNVNNFIQGTSSSDILTNQETIQGSGNIGNGSMGLVNSSTGNIVASHSTPLIIDTSSAGGGFNNQGTLTVNTGAVLEILNNGAPFTNFSGTTLTGGTYNVSGTFEFGNAGTSLVTNAANITLTGSNAQIIDFNNENVLAAFATNATGSSFALAGGANFTTKGNFTNNGTLTVGSGSTFDVSGNLTNFSGTTLSGGTYNVTGTLQFTDANIVTNSASITLTGSSAKIVSQTGANALASFGNNAAAGKFTVTGGQVLSDAATSLTNAGTLTVGKSSQLTLSGASATYTQTAGTTTVDGTLTAGGGSTISGGSVFGNGGTWSGNVTNGGTFNIGDATLTAGSESITGTYTQNSAGALDIDVGGTTAGTQFDQLTVSGAASLNGTLNLDLINGFVPTLGSMFDILNASSVTGTFATVTGTTINGTEQFSVIYNSNNVTLDVVSGAAPLAQNLPSNSPTPEPASLLLLATGLLGVGVASHRKSRGRARQTHNQARQ